MLHPSLSLDSFVHLFRSLSSSWPRSNASSRPSPSSGSEIRDFEVTHRNDGSPPTVHVPYELQASAPGHDAYNKALDEYGPVVMIPRHGRDEYIIDDRYVHEVFTDAKRFSFERALVDVLHIEFMLWIRNGAFVRDCREMAALGLYRRMPAIVEKIGPVFESAFDAIENKLDEAKVITINDLHNEVQQIFAQAMHVLFMGYDDPDSTTSIHFTAIATAMAHLIGIYERIDGWRYAPGLYRFYKLITAGVFTIVPHMFFGLLPLLWKTRHARKANGKAAKKSKTTFVPLFDLFLAELWCGSSSLLGLLNFAYCGAVGVAVIFAAVHQTVVIAVWVIIELANRQDEYLDPIRHEWRSNSNSHSIPNPTNLHLLDSFIREVILSKSNLIGPMRTTLQPVQIGPYILPARAVCIPYPRHLLPQPATSFNGFQWRAKEKQAGQGDPGFFNFGLGQWACPGRHLAIHEMKLLVGGLFARFDLSVEREGVRVLDPLFTMSVPPVARVQIRRREGRA